MPSPFDIRGYMLDISRCKVPTMEQFRRIISVLEAFGYNEFQLYTEHTFAYAGQAKLWTSCSPSVFVGQKSCR